MRRPTRNRRRAIAALVPALMGLSAIAAPSPEEETLRISKFLKPISDDDWKAIAGEKVSQDYLVARGDTLWSISQRLFGDPRYWPKVWALNNGRITNPHVIVPGQTVTFLPGTGSSLPGLGLEGQDPGGAPPAEGVQLADNSGSTPQGPAGKSMEWKLLPRQNWEHVQVTLPTEIDPLGFDRRSSVIRAAHNSGFEMPSFSAASKIATLGEIRGSRSESGTLSLGDMVLIEPKDNLQVGETYAVTREPEFLKSRKSDRAGYAYQNLGSIKIITIRDGMYIGVITQGKGFIHRGDYLIPKIPRAANLQPIPGPRPIEGVLMLGRETSSYTTAQHKITYVDRGADDGVKPGMVFRAYQHRDPSNDSTLTNADFIIDADFMVLQVSETFSTCLAIRSLVPVYENEPAVLLTDVTDLLRKGGIQERDPEQKALDDELDNLDQLDGSGGLGPDEERELKQLEQWKGNPAEGSPEDQDKELDGEPATDENKVPEPDSVGTDESLLTPAPEGEGEMPPATEETPPAPEDEAPPPEETPPATEEEVFPPPADEAPPPAAESSSATPAPPPGAPANGVPPPPPGTAGAAAPGAEDPTQPGIEPFEENLGTDTVKDPFQ